MKEKVLLLDCGGVMVYPHTGNWLISPPMLKVLGANFLETKLDTFRAVSRKYEKYIPDGHLLDDETAEEALMECFYRRVLSEMGMQLSDADYAYLTQCQLDRNRYAYFDDVLPHLKAWHGAVKLGIISDAPPSTRRIMREVGIAQYIDAPTYSFEIGALKPDAAMYLRPLQMLGVKPEEAVFVDDLGKNLRGAQQVGIRGVQMLRSMPDGFDGDSDWDGEKVRNFAELAELLDLPRA